MHINLCCPSVGLCINCPVRIYMWDHLWPRISLKRFCVFISMNSIFYSAWTHTQICCLCLNVWILVEILNMPIFTTKIQPSHMSCNLVFGYGEHLSRLSCVSPYRTHYCNLSCVAEGKCTAKIFRMVIVIRVGIEFSISW